jgi:hypothetical protein
MVDAGLKLDMITDDGKVDIDMSDLAILYYVRCIPGSLVEMEDEKQLRILNEMFVPLSQAMPAIANSGDPVMIKKAVAAMSFIVQKQIELSGASSARDISALWDEGAVGQVDEREERVATLERVVGGLGDAHEVELDAVKEAVLQQSAQISQLIESQGLLLQKLGVNEAAPAPEMPQLSLAST